MLSIPVTVCRREGIMYHDQQLNKANVFKATATMTCDFVLTQPSMASDKSYSKAWVNASYGFQVHHNGAA